MLLVHCLPLPFSNSSGMFISASEDETGVLDAIEEKIARATMLPRAHGEVLLIPLFAYIFIGETCTFLLFLFSDNRIT